MLYSAHQQYKELLGFFVYTGERTMTDRREVSDFRKDHPERMDDEVYFGNFDEEDCGDGTGRTGWECVGWKTKRKGQVAYNVRGVPYLGAAPIFPVFVKQSEINAKDPEITKGLLPNGQKENLPVTRLTAIVRRLLSLVGIRWDEERNLFIFSWIDIQYPKEDKKKRP